MKKLIITGSGIKFYSHLTNETQSAIQSADYVLYLLNEPAIKQWVVKNNKNTQSLDEVYYNAPTRQKAYANMKTAILQALESYQNVCFFLYGHPGVYSSVTQSLTQALANRHDITVQVLPGISALDCLFADLNIDPACGGIQSFEATEFLLTNQTISLNTPLFLWQIGVIGLMHPLNQQAIAEKNADKVYQTALALLKTRLLKHYPASHPLIFYTAAQYPGSRHASLASQLNNLDQVTIPRLSILFIPPAEEKKIDDEIAQLLNGSCA